MHIQAKLLPSDISFQSNLRGMETILHQKRVCVCQKFQSNLRGMETKRKHRTRCWIPLFQSNLRGMETASKPSSQAMVKIEFQSNLRGMETGRTVPPAALGSWVSIESKRNGNEDQHILQTTRSFCFNRI